MEVEIVEDAGVVEVVGTVVPIDVVAQVVVGFVVAVG